MCLLDAVHCDGVTEMQCAVRTIPRCKALIAFGVEGLLSSCLHVQSFHYKLLEFQLKNQITFQEMYVRVKISSAGNPDKNMMCAQSGVTTHARTHGEGPSMGVGVR